MKVFQVAFLGAALSSVQGFTPTVTSKRDATTFVLKAKGFGPDKPKPREKSAGQQKREAESSKYDEISNTGGQEYNIFVRQFGSDDSSWLPAGAVAVPRGAQVASAIYANEEQLKSSIVRIFPKLAGMENEFEFGFNLKIYPDDPVEVAIKGAGGTTDGPSIGNWISTLLSPIDNSQVKPPSA